MRWWLGQTKNIKNTLTRNAGQSVWVVVCFSYGKGIDLFYNEFSNHFTVVWSANHVTENGVFASFIDFHRFAAVFLDVYIQALDPDSMEAFSRFEINGELLASLNLKCILIEFPVARFNVNCCARSLCRSCGIAACRLILAFSTTCCHQHCGQRNC